MFHLFRKDIEKHCAYCKSGSVINEGQVIWEPAMIVVMAAVVGFVIISVIQPIYGSYATIANSY